MAELTLVQFLVALLMSLGAVCLFIWGVLSGLFNDVEAIKYRAYRAEVGAEVSREETDGENDDERQT
jgi:nitrogen fixation-related uncharacterized protein